LKFNLNNADFNICNYFDIERDFYYTKYINL